MKKRSVTQYPSVSLKRRLDSSFLTRAVRGIFGSKVKDSELSEKLKNDKAEYDKNKIAFGNKLIEEKRGELITKGLSEEKIQAELAIFKREEVFSKIILEEREKLDELNVESLPPKEKGVFKKGLDWYLKQPKWKKLAISTSLAVGVAFYATPAAIVGAGGVGLYAGQRLIRSVIGGALGKGAGEAWGAYDSEEKIEKRREEEKLKLKTGFTFESLNDTLSKMEEKYEDILAKEKSSKRARMIKKAAITMAVAGISSFGMAQYATGHINIATTETPATTTNEILNTKTVPSPYSNLESNHPIEIDKGFHIVKETGTYPVPVEQIASIPEHNPVTVEFSSKGAIQTIIDLREEVNNEYGDISKAPHSVQEFMHGSATEQAIKLGMFDPSNTSGAESAMLLKGSTLDFDENGNLSYHDIKTGETHELIHEQENIETKQYEGKMFDSEKSVINHEGPNDLVDNKYDALEQNAVDDHPVAETQSEEMNIKTDNPSDFLNDNTKDILSQNQTDINTKEVIEKDPASYFFHSKEWIQGEKAADADMARIFPKNAVSIDLANQPAGSFMKLNETTEIGDKYSLFHHLNNLQKETGLEPREAGLFRGAETNEEYIHRGYQEAAKTPGKLDAVRFHETTPPDIHPANATNLEKVAPQETASNTNANDIKNLHQTTPETATNIEGPMKHFLDPLGKEHTITINGEKGSSLSMEFSYDENGKITDTDVGGNIVRSEPNPYPNESALSKLKPHDRLDADIAIFKMTVKAEFLDKLPHNTYEYKFVHDEVAHMQENIIKTHGNVINPDKIVTIK